MGSDGGVSLWRNRRPNPFKRQRKTAEGFRASFFSDFESSFERTYEATAAALSADPDGVMLARAFRESHPENLQAAGRALREAGWF